MKKRTDIDFSAHEITATIYPEISIYTFKLSGSSVNGMCFINAGGVMAVTGDFGNWIFNREFTPKKDSTVSDQYWDGKLKLSSTQHSHKYDSKVTQELLDNFTQSFETNYERSMNEEELYWVKEMQEVIGDEVAYKSVSYGEDRPNSIDAECLLYGESRHYWLNAIYDGYDAMCSKM